MLALSRLAVRQSAAMFTLLPAIINGGPTSTINNAIRMRRNHVISASR